MDGDDFEFNSDRAGGRLFQFRPGSSLSLELPGNIQISSNWRRAFITVGAKTEEYSSRDSLHMVMFTLKVEELMSKLDEADRLHVAPTQLKSILWAVESSADYLKNPGPWVPLNTRAGQIAAAWEVGMVKIRTPLSSRISLELQVWGDISRFKADRELVGFRNESGNISILAAIKVGLAPKIWTTPDLADDFLTAISNLSRHQT